MKRLIISEEEKKQILQKHANKGLTLSEKISDLHSEDLEETYNEENLNLDELHDVEGSEELDEFYFGDDATSTDQETGREISYEREEEEGYEEEESGLPENPKYEKSLKDDDYSGIGDVMKKRYNKDMGIENDEPIYEIEIDEDDADAPFEKGPRGMRAARTRADFDPTSREIEMTGVFGKHGEDVPPTTIRYMRKNPGTIIKRMADMYGVDKIKDWLGED